MHHGSCFDPNDQTWHFKKSESDPTCLEQIPSPKECDRSATNKKTIKQSPVMYCGYVYAIAKDPPGTFVRSKLPGYALACGLVDCWADLVQYWMSSHTKTWEKLFQEFTQLHRLVKWNGPWEILNVVSRDRVNELGRLVRRTKNPPDGYDASHVDIAPRVAKRAGELYDELKAMFDTTSKK